jgi:hypothetical protein
MSHHIPVAFLPISIDEIPENLDDWSSVWELLGEKSENSQTSGLRTSTSRNWWHQHAVGLICKHLHIDELGFVQSEIALLDEKRIQAALYAMDHFFALCQNGIPELAPEMEKEGSIWCLRRYYDEKQNIKSFSTEQIHKAYSESEAVYENQDFVENGYNVLVKFFSFLKSVQATLQECLKLRKNFLYVQYRS